MLINKVSRKRPQVAGRALRRPWAVVPLAACLAAACSSVGAAGPAAATRPAAAAAGMVSCSPPGVKTSPCYSPRAYQAAYGVAPLLSRGIDGRGETVVIPDPVGVALAMDIRKDMAAFDREFGLPAVKLHIVNTLAKSTTPYLDSQEEVTDTEMVHAIAPGATIDVVLVPQTTRTGVSAALTEVIDEGIALHAAVVSLSVSRGEHVLTSVAVASLNAALEQARARHVTIVASSGDTGAIADDGPPRQVSLPASDPLVLAVGGTALSAAPGGAYQGEMAWNGGSDASGGGYSILFPRPSYQDGLARVGATRGVPDVAANADSNTAMAETYSGRRVAPGLGHQRRHPAVGGPDHPGRSGGGPAPRLRQPGHLPDRPRPRPPPGIP